MFSDRFPKQGLRTPSVLLFTYSGGAIIGCIRFPSVLQQCKMQQTFPRFELRSPCLYPTAITITLRSPVLIIVQSH